jgi:hypothetical protein
MVLKQLGLWLMILAWIALKSNIRFQHDIVGTGTRAFIVRMSLQDVRFPVY